MNPLSIAVAQPNFTVGDVKKNLAKITDYVDRAKKELGSRAIVFPELSLTGYPPEDLLLRKDFLQQVDDALLELIARTDDIYVIVGHPLRDNNQLFNAASVIYRGKSIASYRKRELPNFGVFDEKSGNKFVFFSIHDLVLWFQSIGIKTSSRTIANTVIISFLQDVLSHLVDFDET